MGKKNIHLFLMITVLFAGCARLSSQGVYQESEIGRTSAVSFGTVVNVRMVDVVGKSTGAGSLVGGTTGGALASQGSNNGVAVIGGIIAGSVVGIISEQAMRDRKGIEYIIVLKSGATQIITQEIGEKEIPIKSGDRVIVQNSGGYQRVLPINNLPTEIHRPKGIKIID